MDVEEEVILVVELSGLPTPDMIKTCNNSCSVLGLDTAEPILQLDNYIFQGSYEDIIGTTLVFKDNGGALEYLCKTGKKLKMNRVILKTKLLPTTTPTITPTTPTITSTTPTAPSTIR